MKSKHYLVYCQYNYWFEFICWFILINIILIHFCENRVKREICYWFCIWVSVNLCDLMLSSAADTYCAISCYIGILSFAVVDFNWCMRNDRLLDFFKISRFLTRCLQRFNTSNVTCPIKSPFLIIWPRDQGSTSRKNYPSFFYYFWACEVLNTWYDKLYQGCGIKQSE